MRPARAALNNDNQAVNCNSRSLSVYSFIPYVLGLGISIGMVWLSVETAITNQTPSMKTAAMAMSLLGVALVLTCVLVLWILATEVVAFEIDKGGSIVLRRLWRKPLTCTGVRLLIKLGCVLRANGSKGECVSYVIVRADRQIVPMPTEVYLRLDRSIARGKRFL